MLKNVIQEFVESFEGYFDFQLDCSIVDDEYTKVKQKVRKKILKSKRNNNKIINFYDLFDEESEKILKALDIKMQDQKQNIKAFEEITIKNISYSRKMEEKWENVIQILKEKQSLATWFPHTFQSLKEMLDSYESFKKLYGWNSLGDEKIDLLSNIYCRSFNLIDKVLFEATADFFGKKSKGLKEKGPTFFNDLRYNLLFNDVLKPMAIKANKFHAYYLDFEKMEMIAYEFEYMKEKYYHSDVLCELKDFRNNITHSISAATNFHDGNDYLNENKTFEFIKLVNFLLLYISINIENKMKEMLSE